MWLSFVDLSISSYSKGHINATIQTDEGWWRFPRFYGNPAIDKISDSWMLLNRLCTLFKFPWVVGGDFNEVLFDDEKEGGAARNPRQFEAFRDALNHCDQ